MTNTGRYLELEKKFPGNQTDVEIVKYFINNSNNKTNYHIDAYNRPGLTCQTQCQKLSEIIFT